MVQSADTFEQRNRRLVRRHHKMGENGVRARMGRDGLVTLVPRRRAPRFPLRSFAIFFLAAITYKAVMLAWFGAPIYEERLAELTSGSIIEQAGAWVLQIDPVTYALADFLQPHLFRLFQF